MFTIDKDKLKLHMDNYIRNSYINIPIAHSGSGEIARAIDSHITDIVRVSISSGVKEFMVEVVDELIDHLYTADDFEKDMGLK